MPDASHKPALSQQDIAAFLRHLRSGTTNEAMAGAAGVPITTLQKWFLAKPRRLEAINFLRVVMALGAEDALVNQIREWREASGQQDASTGLTTDSAGGRPSVKQKRPPIRMPVKSVPHPSERSAGASKRAGKSSRRAAEG